MAGDTKTTTAARRKAPAPKARAAAPKAKAPAPKAKAPAPKAADARDALSVADLARGILSKEIRSRAVDVQRLAEAVLAGAEKPKKAKKDKSKKKKLAKIPGQQAKN